MLNIDALRQINPLHSTEELRALLGGRESAALGQILESDTDVGTRVYTAVHVLPEPAVEEFARAALTRAFDAAEAAIAANPRDLAADVIRDHLRRAVAAFERCDASDVARFASLVAMCARPLEVDGAATERVAQLLHLRELAG